MRRLIKYNAYEPETLELWIPPAFYKDGVIEVLLDKKSGDFAAIGPLYIYRYEYEDESGEIVSGGPMEQESQPLSTTSFTITPNPFNLNLNIRFQTQTGEKYSIKVYDVAGRLVKKIYKGVINDNRVLNWHGKDENGRVVAQGIYFLRIENLDSGETFCEKVLKIK